LVLVGLQLLVITSGSALALWKRRSGRVRFRRSLYQAASSNRGWRLKNFEKSFEADHRPSITGTELSQYGIMQARSAEPNVGRPFKAGILIAEAPVA
jgi:hypothetical protein